MQKRRVFLKQALASGALTALAGAEEAEEAEYAEWPIVVFEKPVQALGYGEIGEMLAGMGAAGIEATIRKGGHIDPAKAATEVPAMMRMLGKSGLQSVIAATDVRQAGKATEEFLKILKDNGIESYRMGYHRYQDGVNPLEQVDGIRKMMLELAELNQALGMQGLYQNHSGKGGKGMVGSIVWDLVNMLDEVDPEHLAIALDLRHLRVDTGNSWKTVAEAAYGHVGALYIKDARWEGPRSNEIKHVPLDSGIVTKDIFDELRGKLRPMPLSVHMEWGKHPVYPADSAREAWPLIRKDVEVLKAWRD